MPPSDDPVRTSRLRAAARTVLNHTWRSYPAFYLRNLPRALRPRTFEDLLRRKMLFDRRPLLRTFADKALARDYVRRMVGDEYLTRAYQIVEDADAIDWSALPDTFACKATHGSGAVVVVTERADPTAKLPDPRDAGWGKYTLHPDRFDPETLTALCRQWLTLRYGWGPGTTHEWFYDGIVPRVLIEELLRQPEGGLAIDYKWYVINGRCKIVQVNADRWTGQQRRGVYRPDWTPIPVTYNPPGSEGELEKPRNLAEMIRIAEALGSEVDFVRVDLYDVGDRIVFGELTNTPSAGHHRFGPPGLAPSDKHASDALGAAVARLNVELAAYWRGA